MKFLFLPLNEHIDYGHGAMGQEFKSAAEQLLESEQGSRNAQLPINYLYRHAVELFLKSTIITLHRTLGIPFADKPSEGDPSIERDGKWVLLRRVHGVADLYCYFKRLLQDHEEDLRKRCKTDWSDVPVELDGWIAAIDDADRASTFFRYPTTGDDVADEKKSTWKQTEPEELQSQMEAEEEGTMSFLIVDENEQVVRSYAADRSAGNECREALAGAVDVLSSAQIGLRMELAGGH